jgi:hypothetical protein
MSWWSCPGFDRSVSQPTTKLRGRPARHGANRTPPLVAAVSGLDFPVSSPSALGPFLPPWYWACLAIARAKGARRNVDGEAPKEV